MQLHSDGPQVVQMTVEGVEVEVVLHLTQRVARDRKDDEHGEAVILVRQLHNVGTKIVSERVAVSDTKCPSLSTSAQLHSARRRLCAREKPCAFYSIALILPERQMIGGLSLVNRESDN